MMTWFWEQSTTGGQFFLTDFPGAPGSPDANFVAPPLSLPRAPIPIARVRARTEKATRTGQICWQLDKGNVAYNTGTPPAHQAGSFPGGFSDNIGCETLASINPGDPQEAWHEFNPPLIWDRTLVNGVPNDRCWLEVDDPGADIVTIEVETDDTITALNWQPVATAPGLISDIAASDAGYTRVVTIAAAQIANLGSSTAIAVALQAASNAGLNIACAYIGPSAGGANPCDATSLTQLLCGGNPGANLPPGGMAFWEAASSVPPSAAGYVVKFYVNSGCERYAAGAETGWGAYYGSGNTADVAAGTAYTQGTASIVGVTEVLQLIS